MTDTPPTLDLGAFQREVHANSRAKGFWDERPNSSIPTKIALLHAECSELLEAHRADPTDPCPKQGCDLSCEEEEMADIFLRLLDLAEARGVDLGFVAEEKHRFNLGRPRKHGDKRF